jgi:hypothetical protein
VPSLCYTWAMPAMQSYFNRLSSNISVDGAMSVFDIVPVDDLDESYALPTPPAYFDFVSDDFYMIPVPSNHTRGNDTGYILKRKTESFVEYPVSMGIPMNYGGVPRVRFKSLVESMREPEPFLMLPSSGLGRTYSGRARSFEFWMNAEPYARMTKTNVLPKPIAYLNNNNGDYEQTRGSIVKISAPAAYPSEYSNTLRYSQNARTVFKDFFNLVGGKQYRFSVMMKSNVIGARLRVQFEMKSAGLIQQDIVIDSTSYKRYEFDFFVSETVKTTLAQLWLTATAVVDLSEPKLIDMSTPDESATTRHPLMRMSLGANQTVTLEADAQYMYLTGYGNTDNFQVSEWARPMYIVFTDTGETFDVYVDAQLVMSINKTRPVGTEPFTEDFDISFGAPNPFNVRGDWIFLYLSPTFKYIDLSTLSLYSSILLTDIQKIHYMFSYGPSYNDVINNTQHEKMYVADGSATTWSSRVMFPLTQPFSDGKRNGLTATDRLALPEYEYPRLDDAVYEDVRVNTVWDSRYGPHNFVIPENSEMSLKLLRIDSNVSHVFIGVSPIDLIGATLCRFTSPNMNYKCDIKIEALDTDPQTFRVYAQLLYSDRTTGGQSYEDYDLDVGYRDDPNYKVTLYQDITGLATPWWETSPVEDRDFVVCLNFDQLIKFPNNDVGKLFGDSQLVVSIIDQIPIKYLAVGATNVINANQINVDPEVEALGIGVVPGIDLLGKTNYMFYASDIGLDIAAAGFWTASIPLANFAVYLASLGKPDLDFILYYDQLQSPQLVSNLTKDIMSYYEISEHVRTDLPALEDDPLVGEYADAQEEFGSDEYSAIGVDVDTGIPTLGRFTDRNIETYVTLDSPVRWPNKSYAALKTERATPSNYIDFDQSPNSVLNTKWEIYDGYAIRIPSNIDVYKYNLKFGVHLNSKSLNTKRPNYNRLELFGIASGDTPANTIAVGTGSYLIIGDDIGVNSGQPFSTHLTAELSQSNYMHRENGFYPHFDLINQKVIPVNFYLTDTAQMAGVSFYMYWKNETFSTTTLLDRIGTLRYFVDGEAATTQIIVETKDDIAYAYQRGNIYTSNPNLPVYIDGKLNGDIEVGRWHLVHIDFTNPLGRIAFGNLSKVAKLSLENDKCVVNFITAHNILLEPENLFASRFGLVDYSVFGRPEPEDTFTLSEKAFIHSLTNDSVTNAADAFATVRVSYDG